MSNKLATLNVTNQSTSAYCGDGILYAGKECDDGNNIDGDGCSSTCINEEADNSEAETTATSSAEVLTPVGTETESVSEPQPTTDQPQVETLESAPESTSEPTPESQPATPESQPEPTASPSVR